jgi:anthranilate synthase/aminodeoxychorismate synthase-like glutamine amidotransferase
MIVVIDNFDSFTYNLVQAVSAKGEEVCVRRNNEATVEDMLAFGASAFIISPGPGRPESAGISMDLIRAFAGTVPILGVCLGHQCIARAYGGRIVHARKVMHGKLSFISHDGTGLFDGIPANFPAVRYHSLAVEEASLPTQFHVCARAADDQEVMAICQEELMLFGVQFHPESIATLCGEQIMDRFISRARRCS